MGGETGGGATFGPPLAPGGPPADSSKAGAEGEAVGVRGANCGVAVDPSGAAGGLSPDLPGEAGACGVSGLRGVACGDERMSEPTSPFEGVEIDVGSTESARGVSGAERSDPGPGESGSVIV